MSTNRLLNGARLAIGLAAATLIFLGTSGCGSYDGGGTGWYSVGVFDGGSGYSVDDAVYAVPVIPAFDYFDPGFVIDGGPVDYIDTGGYYDDGSGGYYGDEGYVNDYYGDGYGYDDPYGP